MATAPFIYYSYQGSQFTSQSFEQALLYAGFRISRDGHSRATEKAFIECLWRSVKRKCVYLNPSTYGQYLYQKLYAYFT
ncbi:hypothetical protein GCM10023185_18720 [Hymenobacter saemangeumensis]|uniref:Integrase catalytic domain-containing protein n=1 Tax=Hymenobacter saemangeumensis TaxID=1084522 RepID=A0ABP8ICD3_9BACT